MVYTAGQIGGINLCGRVNSMIAQQESLQVKEKEEALITGEELAAMGDLGRCELVAGRIVKLSPTKMPHGRYEFEMARLLGDFVEKHDLGVVMVGEVGVYTRRDPDTVRGADVLYISHERLARATPGGFMDVAPELIVEVMSPSDRWSEVRKKIKEYFEVGVTVVLIVEPEEQTIVLYRSPTDIQEFTANDTLTVVDILPDFNLPLARLWANLL
ncbi:MAG: Uma2 family endonuclease [Chloroflexi bacterium]|nr:Uma2 family endonuclease [Chloroflexota bacterium]